MRRFLLLAGLAAALVHRASVLEDLLERLHRQLHDADPERNRHRC